MTTVRAGIYARISLDVAGQGLGVQRQQEACQSLAAQRGWTVTDTYQDNDVSAMSGKPRPEYQRLLADLEAGTIDAVIVYAWDRLARRMADLVGFIDLQKQVGFKVAQVTGDVDLSTAAGRTTAFILGSVAQGEAERLGERVSAQKQQRAMQGIPHKGRYRLYGYDKDWNLIDDEAATMRECFTRRSQGESTTAIAKDLTARGITNVSGKPWTSGTLGVSLTKDVYAGWVTLKGERVAPSIYPAIIDDDTFKSAQRNLANDSKGTNARKYLLSGILICAHCTSPMKGNPSNQMYRCSTTYGGCGRLSVRITQADKYVFHESMSLYTRTAGNATVEDKVDYQPEIDSLTTEMEKYQEGWKAGIYTLKEAQPKIKGNRDRITLLEGKQAQAKRTMPKVQRQYIDFKRMNLSQQRVFIETYLEHVVVHPAISRGNQPFNPSRFEVVTKDGRRYRIEDEYEYDPE